MSNSKSIYTVSQITQAIKRTLETPFQNISVQGEVSNLKMQSSGHIYLTLKDQDSQLSAAIFRGNASQLKRLPKEGDQVIAVGELSVYAPRGNYQLIIRELQWAGIGELLLMLEKRKEEFAKRGYFDPVRKKKLPSLPKTIGVVTSPTGAVIQDILHILERRWPNFQLILNPVKVQGEGAAQEIAQAIQDFNRYGLADVLIVGRGGGSIEDLWAFNEEAVVKAVFESEIPIISAVGHETDYTLCDFAADVRAPTPSAAAEMVIKEKKEMLKDLDNRSHRLKEQIEYQIKTRRLRVQDLKRQPVFYSPYTLLGQKMQRLDDMRTRWEGLGRKFLDHKKILIDAKKSQLKNLSPMLQITNLKQRLTSLEKHLKSLDPKNLLKKGYSILFSEKDSSIILSAKSLSPGARFYALLDDGKVFATAEQVKPNEK